MPQQISAAAPQPNLEFVHGQDFGARCSIIEEIARGGMGRIYKAYDKELNPVYFDPYSDRTQEYASIGDRDNFIRNVRSCLSLKPEAMMCKYF